jgi:CheY-like chemotaxis protein
MINILVVDDSAVDRFVIQGLLSVHQQFEIDTAGDGAVALEKIRNRVPDLVLTDMQMPNMDGLQLVEAIRSRYPAVPVILVTGEGSEDLACMALQRGAAGYVPKIHCKELLHSTIEHVMELRRSEACFKRLIDSTTLCQFEYSIDNDVTLIAPLLELAQRMCAGMKICDEAGCMQIGIALEHAILNAIYHGSLEIGTDDHSDPQLIAQRLKAAPYAQRKIFVELRITREEARFVVGDQGPGFNAKEMTSKARQLALTGETGRGLFLMWAFMDSLTFDEKGNTTVMVKRRSPAALSESNSVKNKAQLPTVMGMLDPHDRPARVSLTTEELRSIVKRLTQLTSNSSLCSANQPEFVNLLKVFKDKLALRFEAFDYFEEALKSATNGGRQSDKLRAQHRELFERAQGIVDAATNGSADDYAGLSKQVNELLHSLEVHEAAETEMIVNAMFQDIGGGD